ncbi:hypothetical protein CEXT_786901 [Caerostris extrusa]|uniref:Uncharacterized protein n=1 Tax=Caerostris extrusa TaxID=172846 RepID=A0AAV4YBM1_CAEEX|nr:hypothetical protein CEXT_786901 [Caerostris extrusa]
MHIRISSSMISLTNFLVNKLIYGAFGESYLFLGAFGRRVSHDAFHICVSTLFILESHSIILTNRCGQDHLVCNPVVFYAEDHETQTGVSHSPKKSNMGCWPRSILHASISSHEGDEVEEEERGGEQ